jgi:tetratricopeptide (TPR) repeat protein
VVRRELCPLAAAAACNLHRWDSMGPLFMYWDEDGSAVAAAASGSSSLFALRTPSTRPGSELRHRYDANYYSAIYLIHRGRFDEARNCLDRAVEILDPQLTALAGESYPRAYRTLLLLQRIGQLEEIIDFKLSGSRSGVLTPRQQLLQRMWSSRMLGGLSRSGDDIEAWSELLMQQQLLRNPGTPYYNDSNMHLYLELCECVRKQAMEFGTVATDVPIPSISLSGVVRKQNPFLARGERILTNLLGFSPLELLPDESTAPEKQLPSLRCMQQALDYTRPRTMLPHLLFAVWKNLYAQGYRIQAFHRLRDMLVGVQDNDVFPRALREVIASSGVLHAVSTGQSAVRGDESWSTYRGVTELDQLKSMCYIRLAKWQMSLLDESLNHRAPNAITSSEGAMPSTPYSPLPNVSLFTFSSPAPLSAGSAMSPGADDSSFTASSLFDALDWFRQSTVCDPSSARAWHEFGMLLAKCCVSWKALLLKQSPLASNPALPSVSHPSGQPIPYVIAAIHAFFRSISLQTIGETSLQDLLRVLALWFEYGALEENTYDGSTAATSPLLSPTSPLLMPMQDLTSPPSSIVGAMLQGLNLIAIEHWLVVIPQLIARIHVASPPIRSVLLELLHRVGKAHPQALIYPLTVASKSPLESRRRSALSVLDGMRSHSNVLVSQASLVSEQLVRVAILWHEMFYEGLEEASHAYLGNKDFAGMMRILDPLHALLAKPASSMSIKEAAFVASYGKELGEAYECCKKFERATALAEARSKEPLPPDFTPEEQKARAKLQKQEARHTASYMTRAWELYTAVFRRLAKQIQSTHELELSDISSQLLLSRDLELAVPGAYKAGERVVRISVFEPLLRIIDSKQHPRRLGMLGSDGVSYTFLLKGHEDLRQDERVMQLLGLVNTLLQADSSAAKHDLSIRRYAVVPLSPNSGLIEWCHGADPIHTVIKRYRDARAILLNIEQRLMVKYAPDYHLCTITQRVEVFDYAVSMTSGQDLANVMWLHAPSSEIWLTRRSRFTSSCAVMSMVGYILGLGDRHTCNLLLEKSSGALVHIGKSDNANYFPFSVATLIVC